MNKEMSETLTRVGPGTRMGELLRRYWVPALASREIAEADGPQVRVQLLGEKLLADNQCAQCHVKQVGGDGSAIYRPQGRINNAGLLRGMVENCSTRLNLQLFPEEVTAIAAVLNRDHYRFKP